MFLRELLAVSTIPIPNTLYSYIHLILMHRLYGLSSPVDAGQRTAALQIGSLPKLNYLNTLRLLLRI